MLYRIRRQAQPPVSVNGSFGIDMMVNVGYQINEDAIGLVRVLLW